MFCTNCGKEIAVGCKFCTNCGTPLNTNPDSTNFNNVQVNPAPEVQNDSMLENGQISPIPDAQNSSMFENGQISPIPDAQNAPMFENGQISPAPAFQNNNVFENGQVDPSTEPTGDIPKNGSRKKRTLFIILIVLLVAAAAVGTAVVLKSNHFFDKEEKTTETSQANNEKDQKGADKTNATKPSTEPSAEPTEEPEPTPTLTPTSTPTPTVDPEGVHSYKVVKKNCTWKDASEAAAKKNSHLATINSDKEWKAILKVAKKAYRQKGITVFWLGARRSANDLTYYWQDSLHQSLDFDTHWLEGEPSYYDPDIEKDECYVELLYVKSKRKWVLNDAPNNITKWFSDKIGYIVETEE